jgi:hypothetical protein
LQLLFVLLNGIVVIMYSGFAVAVVRTHERSPWTAMGLAFRTVAPVLGRLVVVGVAASLAEGVGLALLIVPGLVLLTRRSVVAPVIVVERPSGFTALRRSSDLVCGQGWQVFGIVVLFVVLPQLLADVASAVIGSGQPGVRYGAVLGIETVLFPLAAVAAAHLYGALVDTGRD